LSPGGAPESREQGGVILYDKVAGITSHDVVARVRRRLGRGTKVGHAGTLDPFATGLLLVLVGRAVSSTGDPDGEIVSSGVLPDGDLELPSGVIRQRPPAYSAVKIAGRRAYQLAREGVDVQTSEREVEVHRFDERWREPERRGYLIECSSGTYVRTLISELGDAYCEELRRTRIGAFDVADADPDRILPLAQALGFLPELQLDAEHARSASHGRAVPGVADGPVRLTDATGLIALAEPVAGTDSLKPVLGLR
jgi:tRNA pseudouridine55 synthase